MTPPADIKDPSRAEHLEKPDGLNPGTSSLPPEIVDLYARFEGEREKRLTRKMDSHLIPILTALYLFAYIDRGNIGNARIFGMEEDLNLSDKKYNLALTIFFISYCTFEIPSNVLLKRFKPKVWITFITISWGIIMTLMGLIHNWEGLLATRFMLGIPESGIFPACAYYVTSWYPRREAQYRTALFYASASLAGAFSGLLAYVISLMDGVGGLAGWKWVFIIEGLLTVLGGVIAYFVIWNTPNDASWLTEEEKRFIIARLAYDGNSTGLAQQEEGSRKTYIKSALTDWQVYLNWIFYLGISVSTYGIVFGLPTIITGLGYKARIAQLMTVPPYVVASCLTIVAAHFSDKTQRRGLFVISGLTTALIGFVIAIATSDRPDLGGVTYAGCFIACCGFYPAFPGVVAWLANNTAGPYKRAISIGLQLSLGNLGGFVGSNIYLARDRPAYRLGYGISLGFIFCAILAAGSMMFFLNRINKKRDEYVAREGGERAVIEKYGEWTLAEMGDRSPLFRYTI
ncbi:hypothetical protein FPRO06_07716 [Fusarium proliferatum]|nr:hypothetical protein FPRO06_07716 [Fusarium proliferatum]CVL13727.1 related to MFS nicotinic acid transporter Tna1 [Fusarium proliferatum]